MIFDPNSSPCRACPDVDSEDAVCRETCTELILFQTAVIKAEAVGLPKPGTCPICRKTWDGYCDQCRKKTADRTEKMYALAESVTHQIDRGPYRKVIRKYKWMIKKSKFATCEICNKIISVGAPCNYRNMSNKKKNYRYAHEECAEKWQAEAHDVAVEYEAKKAARVKKIRPAVYRYKYMTKTRCTAKCELCPKKIKIGDFVGRRKDSKGGVYEYAHVSCIEKKQQQAKEVKIEQQSVCEHDCDHSDSNSSDKRSHRAPTGGFIRENVAVAC